MRISLRRTRGHSQRGRFRGWYSALCVATFAFLPMVALAAKTKVKAAPPVNAAIEVTASLTDAVKAVEEVAADPVVYGTYVYERDKILTGAHEADASSAFGKEVSEGKI